jgi:hypothetical protein
VTQNRPTLTVIGGPHDGEILQIDAPSERLLGSGPTCHLKLDLTNLAPVHARLVWDARGLILSDAGSETGTYVNGERLAGERALADGDRLFLGPPGSKNTAKLLATGVPPAAPGEAVVLNLDHEQIFLHGPDGNAVAAAAAKAGAAGAKAHTSAKPDYVTELPSIAPADRVREELAVPPVAPPMVPKPIAPRVPAIRLSEVPRPVLIGAATLLLVGGGTWAYLSLRQPPPMLASLAPARLQPGDKITLTGTGFGASAEHNKVHFGDQVGQVASASETQLTVTVPAGVVTGDVQVKVEREGSDSNTLFVKVFRPPSIAVLEPDVAQPGSEVVARGQNFAEGATVAVGGQPAQVLEAKVNFVRFRLPAELSVEAGRGVAVNLSVGSDIAKPVTLFLGHLPYLLEAVPNRGSAGDRVVLRGRGFDPDTHGNFVTFGSRPALVLKATATELTVTVPGAAGQSQEDLPVAVRSKGRTSSSPLAFTLQRPSLGVYTPRYFPEPAVEHPGHDHAFVACELGPVLLLSGKADAASTAERASKVAAALNALADQTDAIVFESRDDPAPGVGIAGRPELLVAVTPEDSAGYGEPWSTSGANRAPSPQRLASYWTALLQDHRLLFFQKDRPVKLLELSSRAKVLSELYAEATRRSGPGQGVPASLPGTLTPEIVRGLRELALLLPPESAEGAASARAVEGLWEGTMQEAGVPEKPVSVRLQIAGSRLAGTLTTKVGKVAMDVPLRDVSYSKGALKFTLVSGGVPRVFSGSLQGDTLSGTIQGSGGSGPAGRFSLKYRQ